LRYKNILRGVSLDIKQGEFITIAGASGAGKSTLLRNIVGLYKSDGGEIEVGGVKNDRVKKYGKIKNVIGKKKGQLFEYIKHRLNRAKKIGINKNVFSVNEYEALKKYFKKCRFIDISQELTNLRQIKTKEEILLIKKSASIASKITEKCILNIKKLKTEIAVKDFLEVETKKKFNQKKKRLALAGVCRFDSKSNDLLQIVDLLIGAITYDIKFAKKLVDGSKYKIEIVDYLRNKLGADTFIKGFKNHNFNIFVDKTDHLDMIQNKGENEKGLSS